MLDTGFDCPPVVNLVFTRFTRSSILYQQMRGRGTRKNPGKPSFTMFDFAGVCDYHGDDDEIAEGGLVAETPRKKHYEARRLLALDIDDHIDPTTREWITLDENGNMVFPEISEQKAAELGARFEAWLLSQNDLSPTETSWLRVVGSQLRANVESWQEFTPRHFAFHPFTLMGGYPGALRVFGGEERLYTIFLNMNDAIFPKHAAAPKGAVIRSTQPNR